MYIFGSLNLICFKIQIVQLFPIVLVVVASLCLQGVAGQKGGAKGAMRGRGRGKSGRGQGGRRQGQGGEVDGNYDNFGGGYGGKGRPCVGLCYLR